MVAEAVSSSFFRAAVDALDEGKRIEVEFAIYAIEEDPDWRPPNRFVAPSDSPYTGFIADLSVRGFAIVYHVVDRGASVELWYLYPIPDLEPPAAPRRAGPPPMM